MNFSKLSRKQLLKDVSGVSNDWIQLNSDSSSAALVTTLRDSLSGLLCEKSQLDEQQNTLKGAVGRAKRAGESAEKLIVQMRASATSLKKLNVAINDTADILLRKFQEQDNNGVVKKSAPSAPGQFLAQHWKASEKAIEETNSSLKSSQNEQTDQNSTYHSVQVAFDKDQWHISETLSAVQWDAYVSSHPEATHYHYYQWRNVVSGNFPQQHWYVGVVDSSDEIQGVLSLIYMNSPISGKYLLSMPWLIYGGCLVSHSAASDLLAAYSKQKMVELGCSHIELRQVHARSDWELMPGKVAMVLSLPRSIKALNDGFGAALRSQIRRAAAHKPCIEFGGAELVQEFYQVFCEKMRDLGTPVYHKGFFEAISTNFKESTTFVVVRMDGKPAAAAVLIKHRDTIEIPWAAAKKKYNPRGVNMYMYHQLLEYAVFEGFKFFDFGRSGEDSGTYRFKKQWGASPQQLGWHRFPTSEAVNSELHGEKVSLKFRIAIAVWKKLPVWLTKLIGPPISRHLPW